MATAVKERTSKAVENPVAAPAIIPVERPALPAVPSEIESDPTKLLAATLLGEGALLEMTYEQVAETVGITSRTLRTWRNEPAFQQAVLGIARKQLKDALPTAYKGLLDCVRDKDRKVRLRAIELLLKASGEMIERMEVSNPKAEAVSILAALDAEIKSMEGAG